jgi:hypothetical protein
MSQTFTDPASGRPYIVDQATGVSRWLDQPPAPPVVPPIPGGPQGYPSGGYDGGHDVRRRPKTVAGVVGLIVGLIGLMLSWVPIVNTVGFFFALISGILGVVGLVATRSSGKRSARWTAVAALVLTALTIAIVIATQAFYGKVVGDVGKAIESAGPVGTGGAVAGSASDGSPAGVTKFGAVATFKDSSTLTCAKPVPFKRDQYASGGETAKALLKTKCTFTNHSSKVFNPSGTTGSMSAGGAEGDSVYQAGLDAPDNPVLPGKSVSWWMGYGVQSTSDVQLTIGLGFLDYAEVTFV